MLHLFGATEPDAIAQSDAICTALQLINILQDVGSDLRRGRIYLPQSELAAFAVTEEMLVRGEAGSAWRALMKFQIARCRTLLDAGAPLGRRFPGRFGLELRLVIEGARAVLRRIEQADYDVFGHRLILRSRDWPGILWRAIIV
jgi:phytoene/squalene synthetase